MNILLRRAKKSLRHLNKKNARNYALLALAGLIFFTGIFFIWASNLKIPTLESFETRRVIQSTKIFDKTGEILLYDVNQDVQRTVIPFDEISRNAKNATIAIEDREFYSHNGIKPKSILRAIFANTTSLGYSQGGSTITQQVVKNSLLSTEKKISRKIKEWVLAVKLEKILSKDEILNLYFNEIPYGGNMYGIEEASQTLLGKSAHYLSIAEAAYLAAIPQAPTYYSPYGKNRNKLEERKNLVLLEMKKNGFITEEEYKNAKEEIVQFKEKETENLKAPHFVFYVINELEKKYGEEIVQNGGLHVKTTLDYNLQKKGEEIANRFALDNKEKFNAENSSFVAIDPKTGGILAMVGSRNFFDKEIDGNFNIATAHRQPGSTFKPFVYAEAFNKGYTPETVVFDVKTQFSTNCSPDNLTSEDGCYSPDNYDLKYRGPITLRDSLAQSINISSVKTLYLAGIDDSIRLAEKMGIQSLSNAGQYGLTLVLGGGEVSLLDMTSAYSVFANEGIRNPYVSILEVKDSNGEILEKLESKPKDVLNRETALKISSILSDNVARAPAFGQSSFLHFENRDVAVKTGTTNDYKDAWIIGYTPSVVLGAWAGNNDNTPMEKKVAGFIVAPMWRAFMDEIISTMPNESFPEPIVEESLDLKPVLRGKWQGGNSTKIDSISGKLATEFTPKETIKEIFSGGVHSILYWVEKEDPRGPIPKNPSNDPQFVFWEEGVKRWLDSQNYTPEDKVPEISEFDDVHGPNESPKVNLAPLKNEYKSNENITLTPTIQSKYPITKVEYYVGGKYIGEQTLKQFSISFIPKDFGIQEGEVSVLVVATDKIFNKGQVEKIITIED